MRFWLLATALSMSIFGAALAFGVRLTMIDTPAAKTLHDIVYDGGPVQQIWSGFSATITAYVGPLVALLVLGWGAAFAMYLVFLFSLKLLARLANEAVQTVVSPVVRAAGFGKDVAAGGVDAVMGGIGIVKDGMGRMRDRGVDVAKNGFDNAVAAKDALVNVAGNIGARRPGTSKQAPEVTPRQVEGVSKT